VSRVVLPLDTFFTVTVNTVSAVPDSIWNVNVSPFVTVSVPPEEIVVQEFKLFLSYCKVSPDGVYVISSVIDVFIPLIVSGVWG